MRLLRLDLIAFGPFTDRVLDFSAAPEKLQIVLGSNEAGKSTSLRALEGLLFGIEARTPDAHTHPYGELRVGGILESASGARLDVVRRKGVKGTLRDRRGDPIDDGPLRALLRGVDVDAFRALYGLDHETLRLGADALERAQGKVGESLFDAGLGGLGVGQAIQAFADEADELFTPLARKKPLNEAIRALVEARREVRIESTSPEAVPEQERAIEAARIVAKEAEAERRALLAERQKLKRVTLVSPGLERRARLLDARNALGAVALLADSATQEREQAAADRAEATARIGRLEEEIARRRAELASISAPRALLEVGATIERIKELASVVSAAELERPRLEQELAHAAIRRGEILARLGGGAGHELVTAVNVPELVVERDGAELYAKEAELRVSELALEIERMERELVDLPIARDTAQLSAAIDEASPLVDLSRRLATEEGELDAIGERIDASLASLGLFHGTADDLVRLALPPIELCAQAEAAARERGDRAKLLHERVEELEERARDRARELSALMDAGAPPTEEALAEARRARDAIVLLAERGEPDALPALRRAIAESDALADRLRREAARVERRAQLVSAVEEARDALADARARERALAEEEARERAAWIGAWRASGLAPLGPAEMRSWLERRRAIVELVFARQRSAEKIRASRAAIAGATDALVAASRAASGETAVDHRETSIVAALSEARAALTALERSRLRREAFTAALDEGRAKLERARADAARTGLARDAARDRWAAAMLGLGLDASATAAEADARAADLRELARSMAEVARLEEALGRIVAREEELSRDLVLVEATCSAELSDLGEVAPVPRALAIARRFAEAREGDIARRGIVASLTTLDASLVDERGRLGRALAKLAELARAAGVAEAELPAAEARSLEAQRLDREIEAVTQEIRAHGGAASFDELAEERASLAGVDVAARLDELDELIEASASRRDRAHHDVGAREVGLRSLERKGEAADLALAAEAHLARAATLLRRYAVARLAKTILEREVERYRASHQTPILKRAEELFTRLTGGRYRALKVVVETDAPELLAVRAGREIPVAGLSDGTRDQLFLALRLATLERHATFGEPMPLVLDDVFVHFDDERTRAGLEVLAELARTVQVLLFTHHARVVELAERAPAVSFALQRL